MADPSELADLEAEPAYVPASPIAERRLTTILFGDLVGFTTLSEKRDAEEVRELLSQWFQATRIIIERYGGTIEKFIGDAVMAVWSVPIAREDDAERAVRAGLELVKATEGQAEVWGTPGITMRVGVVTGEVAVTVGATGEGMVAGDSVNTASRVQSVARPGQVNVDETTRSLTTAAITYESVGVHELKGKAEPVHLFQAMAVVGSVRGNQRGDGLEAAIAGRDRELRLIKELFHAAEDGGQPALVLVEGEAGVGKTRLAWEFEKYTDGLSASVRWHRGRCSSYGDGIPFWALAEAIRARLGLGESDSGDLAEQKLDEGLRRYVLDGDEREWLRARLAILLGLPSELSIAREELFAAWAAFLERVAAGDVVVLVVDDAQRADDGLLSFLEFLLGTAQFSIFVLALARPGLVARRPDLAASPRTTLLHLDPLGDVVMGQLIDGLVSGLPATSREQLVERSEGIPLFAVETVRALIDRGLVISGNNGYVLADGADVELATLSIPVSLQSLIGARLDSLTRSERRVVTDASVLGSAFTVQGMRLLTTEPDSLDAILDSLVRKQILALETDPFSSERGRYRFVQAVVRQVAYDSISRRDRKARHLAVAQHLAVEEDPGDDNAGMLARHYLSALESSADSDADRNELLQQAIELMERAAARAQNVGAPSESLRLLQSAMELTDDLAITARLNEAACRSASDTGAPGQGFAYGKRAIELFEQMGDWSSAGRAAAETGRACRFQGDKQMAIDLMRTHWDRLAEDPNADPRAILRLAQQLTGAHQERGEYAASTQYVQRMLPLAEANGDLVALTAALNAMAMEVGANDAPFTNYVLLEAAAETSRQSGSHTEMSRALMNLAIEALARDVGRGVELLREAATSVRKSGVVDLRGHLSVNLAVALWTAGEWEEFQRLVTSEELVNDPTLAPLHFALAYWLAEARGDSPLVGLAPAAPSDSLSDLSWASHSTMLVARRSGDMTSAVAAGAASVAYALRWSGLGDDFIHLWPPAVETALLGGDLGQANALLAHVGDVSPTSLTPALAAHLPRLRGLVAAASGADPAIVEADLRLSIDRLRDWGAGPMTARAQSNLGRWLMERDREDEAHELLEQAHVTFVKLDARGWDVALKS